MSHNVTHFGLISFIQRIFFVCHKPNGEELKFLAFHISERVGDALVKGLELTAGHPYYGGMGLIYCESTYVFGASTIAT
jgi:hypothetical protein